MANTYYSVYEHIVFSTKNRARVLTSQIQRELFPYLSQAVKNHGCLPVAIGGLSDHIHLLVRKKNTLLTSDLVKEIKRTSTTWLKKKGVAYGKFNWQAGYGAFSVSYWDLDKIKRYIENQSEYHQKTEWRREYRKLLEKHGVDFDERYFLD